MGRPCVLLADDHPTLVNTVAEILQAEVDVISTVANGQAAVDAVGRLKPDLVVLDISMPVLGGLEAARQIRTFDHPPCVVFLTVHEDPAFMYAAREAGAIGYVLKRRVAVDLLQAVRQALAGQPFFPATNRDLTGRDPVST